jgi:hypothetical protein
MRANALENHIAEYLRERFFIEGNEDYLVESAREILDIIDRAKIHELDLMAEKLTIVQVPPHDCQHIFYELSLDEDGYSRQICLSCKHTFIFNTNTQEYVK